MGEMGRANKDGKALVERHPENAAAHFALSYALRYGGVLEESARECDSALSLDPGEYLLRSCSATFDQLGNYERGMVLLQLDIGSLWVSRNLVRHYIRVGNLAQAREASEKLGDDYRDQILNSCLNHAPSGDVDNIARELAPEILASPDAENRYMAAPTFAFCGKKDIALRLLKSAVAGHYCAYNAMQNDPILPTLPTSPKFTHFLSAAKQCRDDFLSERSQAAH